MWQIFLIVTSSIKTGCSQSSTWPSTTSDPWPSTTSDPWPTTTSDPWPSTTSSPWPSTTSEEGGCPIGWIDNGALGCFLFSADMVGLSWIEALEYCEEQGGFLAEPKTAEQFEFVSSLAYLEQSLTGVPAWWVGLADFGHEGEWVWQFDREDAIISTWDISCPDVEEHNSRDCVALVSKASQDGKQFGALYRDLECDSSFQDFAVGVICQREGLETSTTEASTTSTTTPTPTTTTPYGLHVELQGGFVGTSEAYGNVFAVNSNGAFGPVCDDNWGSDDVQVVCRQLGYSYGDTYANSHWGSVPEVFAMDDVGCNGNEMYLQDCSYRTSDNCAGSEGAGVHCYK